ncbi:MAG: phosphomannomutase [Oceanobacter sp.]
MNSSKDILTGSGVKFGTSGARGLVEQFSDQVCGAFALAFADVMKRQFDFDRIAIAIDRRPSSPGMAEACASVLKNIGLQVDYYGVLPTPALALKAIHDDIPSIMITGSHIPFDRNGIKFYRPDGEIDKHDELAILASEVSVPNVKMMKLVESSDAQDFYLQRYTNLFSSDLLSGKKIGVYEHSAAGREINVIILKALGASVVSLGRTDIFVPIDTEAVSEEDQKQAKDWVEEHQLDAIISTDGDGDRPLLSDEKGAWLRGDILGLLCAKALGVQALAVPVSCNTAIDRSAAFMEVLRTRIGSPYVIEGMQALAGRYDGVAGFEANGGFLLQTSLDFNGSRLEPLPTRDALLPVLVAFHLAFDQGQAVSEVVDSLPSRYTSSDRIKEFPTEKSRALLDRGAKDADSFLQSLALQGSVKQLDLTDGLRLTIDVGSSECDIVHLRPSGNAPELRCYAESATPEGAQHLVASVLSRVVVLD